MSTGVAADRPLEAIAAGIALGGIYVFAFSAPWSTSLVEVGLFLIVVGSLPVLPLIWRDLRREPVFWVTLVLVAYLAIHSTVYLHLYPRLDEMKNPNWSHWLRTAGLWSLLLGWWLYRRPNHAKPLVLALILGLFFGVLVKGGYDSVLSGELWAHRRSILVYSDYLGYSPNYLGLATGAAILSITAWVVLEQRGVLNGWQWAGTALLLVLLVMMFIGSGSRSAWLALPAGLGVVFLYGLVGYGARDSLKPVLISTLFTGAILVGLVFVYREFLFVRLEREWDVLFLFLSLDWAAAAEIPAPLGYRVAMWMRGMDALLEAPMFGWGAGSGIYQLEGEGFGFRHFHNIYLELLVSFGFMGAAGFLVVHGLIYARTLAAYRSSAISRAMFVGLGAVTLFLLIKLSFEIRIGHSEGRALITSLYAFHAYAMYRFRERLDDGND